MDDLGLYGAEYGPAYADSSPPAVPAGHTLGVFGDEYGVAYGDDFTAPTDTTVDGHLPGLTGGLLARRTLPDWDPATMLGADNVHPNDVGMTFLADLMQDALYYAGATPASGSLLTAYGDSWTSADMENTPGLRAVEQLRDRLGLSLTNNAVTGYKAEDCAVAAIGTTGTFVVGTGGTVLVASAGLNDLLAADTAQQRAASANGLRALFAALVAAERIEQTAFTFSGTWGSTNSTLADASGDSNAYTTTPGASASYTVTTAGTYYLLTHGVDLGTFGATGAMVVTQGATTLATIDLRNQHVDTGHLADSGFGPLSVRLEGVVPGTLTVTLDGLSQTPPVNGFIDALLRVDPDPPVILAVKPVTVTGSSYAGKDALLGYVRDLYDTMATEFGPTVIVADPDSDFAFDEGVIDGSLPTISGSLAGTLTVVGSGSLDGTLPGVHGSLSGSAIMPVTLDGHLPNLAGSLALARMGPTGELDGQLPALAGDLSLIEGIISSTRWILHDPVTNESWTMPINPDSMTAFGKQRTLKHVRYRYGTTSTQQVPGELELDWSGVIRSQVHYDTLLTWAAKTNAILVTDHVGRRFRVYITDFQPTDRAPIPRAPKRWRYTMKAKLLEKVPA